MQSDGLREASADKDDSLVVKRCKFRSGAQRSQVEIMKELLGPKNLVSEEFLEVKVLIFWVDKTFLELNLK
jgi:hypothetical protein